MAVFNILNNKVIYYDAPKCGSTTILAYVNLINNPELLREVQKLISGGMCANEAYLKFYNSDESIYSRNVIVSKTVIRKTAPMPLSEIKFCIVRDPIERFISTYKAMILSRKYIITEHPTVDNYIKVADTDKSAMKDWVEISSNGWKNVNFHFRAQTSFYGNEPKMFTHIFKMNQIEDVKGLLERCYGVSLPSLKLNDTIKTDITLTEDQNKWIKKQYADDYTYYGNWI